MAEHGKEMWSEAIDKAKENFNAGWKELGKAAELAKAKGQDAWGEAQDKGRDAWVNAKAKGMEMWDDTRTRGKEMYSDARDRGEEVIDDAEKLVRKHPMRAIGLVLFIGVVVGALLGRDRD
jgi:ElaB/YqjD/DUF883 family membrane-anchored ribosome-binding protein